LASRRSLSENRWPHAYLWHAVDAEGDVLDVLVQAKRNKRAALKLMLKLLKKYGFPPETLVTDELRSYQPPRANLGSRIGIAPADGETIGPRIRIGLHKVLARLCAKAGLEGVTLHVLQHSFAATAAGMGYSELTIAGLLGHSVPGVTARYAHVPDAALVSAADHIAAIIAAALDCVAEVGNVVPLRQGVA
jgi:hypothetical protein